MMKGIFTRRALALLLFVWPHAGAAQVDALAGDPDEVSTRLTLERAGWSGLAGSGATLAYTESAVDLSWQFLILEIDHREYDWQQGDDFTDVAGGRPWGSLSRIEPGMQYLHDFGAWQLWARLSAIAGFEDGVSARAWTYNPQAVALRALGERTVLAAGAGVLYHPASTTFYPVLGVARDIGADAGLSGFVGFPLTTLRYHLDEEFALRLDFQWDLRIYRLAGDNVMAPHGYVKLQELRPGLHLEYRPGDALSLSAGVLNITNRDLTVFDRDEREVVIEEIDSAWAFRLDLAYRF